MNEGTKMYVKVSFIVGKIKYYVQFYINHGNVGEMNNYSIFVFVFVCF